MNKILNLTLSYRGKHLDTIKHNRDFKNKFIIGSDKHLFWQILDKNFPQKHTFLTFSGGKYVIHLLENMDISVRKNDDELSHDEIGKMLINNKLQLSANINGSIAFADWEIGYKFVEPFKLNLKHFSKAEIATAIKKYGRREPISKEHKFTTFFLLFGLLFTAVGLYIGTKNYVPPAEISFTERFQKVEEIATRIEAEMEEIELEKKEDTPKVDVTKHRAETAEAAEEAVEKAQEVAAADFAAEFGLEFDETATTGGDDFGGEILEIAQVNDIVVAPQTGGGSGTGEIPGSGSGSALSGSGSGELDFGSGGDFGGFGDGGGLGDLGSLSGGNLEGLDLGGAGLEEIDISAIGGKIGNLKTIKIQSNAQLAAAKKKFAGVKAVKEEAIELEEITPEAKTEIAKINQIVNTYRPQIASRYRVESMKYDMYGTMNITLYIEENGTIVAVEFDITVGSHFTDEFLEIVRAIILKWKIPVKEAQIFEFRQKFVKQ
ncbi:MAG: hypothetical protein HN952_03095 [Candidatus Cloacimonetes bacterium]|nr:hypothetical protein [Candidatus Cloacimonadota bacterium]MBT6993922.1 hypothetical protein [Candidatus Cloacimonadota bacterium]MBT7469310.1 hypothetical protein [Candidatus Cloacimonadota bacterium]